MNLDPKEISPIIHSACETLGISVEEAFKLIHASHEVTRLNSISIATWIKFCNLVFLPYEVIYQGYSRELHIAELKKNAHRVYQTPLPQTAELKKIVDGN